MQFCFQENWEEIMKFVLILHRDLKLGPAVLLTLQFFSNFTMRPQLGRALLLTLQQRKASNL